MLRWFRSCFVFLVCRFFFRRIRVPGFPPPEPGRPVLYVGMRKSVSLDEWVASFAISPRLKFMTASNGGKFEETSALHDPDTPDGKTWGRAVRELENGTPFFLFGEPEKDGGCEGLVQEALLLARPVLQKRTDLLVVPVFIAYDNPNSRGNTVEILLGNPLVPSFGESGLEFSAEAIGNALKVAEGWSSFTQLPSDLAEQLALLAAVDGEVSLTLALRTTSQLPLHAPSVEAWRVLRERCTACRLVNGIPLLPTGPVYLHFAELLLSMPAVTVDCILNCVPLAAVFLLNFFTRRRPKNFLKTRILVGVSSLAAWTPVLWTACAVFRLPVWLPLLHLVLSASSGYCRHTLRTSRAQTVNGLRHPELIGIQARLREELLSMMR